MSKKLLAAGIYGAILQLFRRNRAVGNLHGTDLRLIESQFLSELDAHPKADLGFLSRVIALDQSSVSRIAQRLSKKGYLSQKHTASDRRRWELSITAKGRKAMAQIDQGANALLKKFSACFSKAELSQLKKYLARFSDGFGHPASAARPGEHLLRSEQRRVARCLKLIGESEVPTANRMVLRLLNERHRPLSASEIAEILSLQRSAVSVIIRDFIADKSLVSRVNPADSRGELFSITENGRLALVHAESKILEVVESALTDFSDSECAQFFDLLQRFTGQAAEKEFKQRFKIVKLISEADRRRARVFYLEQTAQLGLFDEVPECLFDQGCSAFGAEEKGSLVMVAQFRGRRKEKPECFASSLRLDEFNLEDCFVKATTI